MQKKAQKSVAAKQKQKGKTMAVTLKGRGAKTGGPAPRGAAKSNKGGAGGDQKIPKSFSIEPTQTSRPVSIKDFVLPKDTKMTISFAPKSAPRAKSNKAPVKKATTTKRGQAKTMTVVTKKGQGKGKTQGQQGKKKPQAKKQQVQVKKSPKGKGKKKQ